MRIAVCMRRAAWTFFATAALAAMAVWLAGDLLIHPVRHGAGVPPPDLPLRDVVFASDTGAPLHGWFIPGQPGQGAVLLLHGVRASRLSMVARSRFLHRAGYAVLLIDFQASGESPGDAITFGYREAFDVAASVRELRRLAPGESIGVIGTSMGGAATVLAGSSVQVDAVVLEQVYPSIDQALRDRLELHAGIVGRWLAMPFLATLRPHLGISPRQLRPIDHIGTLAAPKLLIAGACDRHTKLGESLAMYRRAASPKSLWIVPSAAHVDLHRFAGDAYEAHVLDFFDTWLKAQRASRRLRESAHPVEMLSGEEIASKGTFDCSG